MISIFGFAIVISLSLASEALMDSINAFNYPKNPKYFDNTKIGRSKKASDYWHRLKFPRDIFFALAYILITYYYIIYILIKDYNNILFTSTLTKSHILLAYPLLCITAHLLLRVNIINTVIEYFREHKLNIY